MRLLSAIIQLTASAAHAQDSFIPGGGPSVIPGCNFATGIMTSDCIPSFLAHVLGVLFGFTGGISVIMIMISGFQFALGEVAGGKDAAKNRLIYAIVGFLVSALALVIIQFMIASIL